MGNVKAISNEAVIAAIMEHGSIKAAACSIGISQRAIYDRMNHDNEFINEYRAANTEILREALKELNSRLSDAIGTVAEIMQDRDNKAATRLQAAQIIINTASKFSERLKECEAEEKTRVSIIDL